MPHPANGDLSSRADADLCDIVRGNPQQEIGTAAFGVLYARHRDAAMAQAYTMLGERDRAEDLVEESFSRMLRALVGGKGPTESVLGYLLVALRSEAVRVAASEREVSPVSPHSMIELLDRSVPDLAEALSERDQIMRAFAQLPDSARRLLWLVEVEESSLDRAAEHMGMSHGALRVALHRARKRLATAYLQQYVEHSDQSCAPYARHLADLVRGGLGKRETRRVERHLTGCQSCVAQRRRLFHLEEQLRSWVGPVFAGVGGGSLAALGSPRSPGAEAVGTIANPARADGPGAFAQIAGWIGITTGGALVVVGAFSFLLSPGSPELDSPVGPEEPGTPLHTRPADQRIRHDKPGPDPQMGPPHDRETPSTDMPATSPRNGTGRIAEHPVPNDKAVAAVDDNTPYWRLRE